MAVTQATEAPEVLQALDKAQEYAELAALAVPSKKRAEYERLKNQWLDIAAKWRVLHE